MQRHIRKGEYTFEEKKRILDYIIKTKCYSSLRGNAFWQDMEDKKIINRTWQSVKEHFKKKLVDNIHTFHTIPQQERERIKEGWLVSRAPAYKRKKPKRSLAIENKFSDEGSGISETYVISDESDSETTETRGDNIGKNKAGTSNVRKPMPKNLFSDEEDEETNIKKRNEDASSHDSPDLLNLGRDDRSTPDINTNEIIVLDEEASNDVTIMPIEIDETTITPKDAAFFSFAEDMLLINFMKRDKTYLERKDRLKVYEIFHEIYPDSKPPELLKNRFLLHILPNICNYSDLSCDEIIKIFDDARMDIPQNIINFLLNDDRYEEINEENDCPTSMEVIETNEEITVIDEEKNKSVEISQHLSNLMENANLNEGILVINEDNNNRVESSQDLNNSTENAEKTNKNSRNENSTSAREKSKIKCFYSHEIINNQSELFVSLPEQTEHVNKILNFLSAKFKISMDHIHYIQLPSVVLLEQIQYIRNLICQKRVALTCQNITNLTLRPQDIISSLESCLATLNKYGNEISSESENTINTQVFQPTQISTPEKKSVKQEIKSEFLFCESEDLHVDHNYCAQLNIKSENVSPSEMDIKQEVIIQPGCSQDNSQCLESVPSPNSSNVQEIIAKMVHTQTQDDSNTPT